MTIDHRSLIHQQCKLIHCSTAGRATLVLYHFLELEYSIVFELYPAVEPQGAQSDLSASIQIFDYNFPATFVSSYAPLLSRIIAQTHAEAERICPIIDIGM